MRAGYQMVFDTNTKRDKGEGRVNLFDFGTEKKANPVAFSVFKRQISAWGGT